jgi:hypothetical protein
MASLAATVIRGSAVGSDAESSGIIDRSTRFIHKTRRKGSHQAIGMGSPSPAKMATWGQTLRFSSRL